MEWEKLKRIQSKKNEYDTVVLEEKEKGGEKEAERIGSVGNIEWIGIQCSDGEGENGRIGICFVMKQYNGHVLKWWFSERFEMAIWDDL